MVPIRERREDTECLVSKSKKCVNFIYYSDQLLALGADSDRPHPMNSVMASSHDKNRPNWTQ